MSITRLLVLSACSVLIWSCQRGAASASLLIPHPDDASKQIEYFLESPAGKGPWPTIVLLHGHQSFIRPGGRVFADWGVLKQFAGRGYLAVAVSQPGYGNSSGPADFGGEFTQHAVTAVIAALRAQGLASRDKLLVEGMSLGAVTAGLIAARDPSLSGAVLISGVYDLAAYVEAPDPSLVKRTIVWTVRRETGGSPDALNARSILRYADDIKASLLILNGAQDDRTDPAQARSLADRVTGAGGKARAIIYPDVGHKIPVEMRNKDIDPFIDSVLGARS